MNDTNEKKPESNNRPDPKLKNNKPRFSYYWIYALLAVLIIGLQLMNWNTTVKNIGWGELKEMILNQEIERLVLVNKEFAEVFIKKDKLALEKFKEVRPGEGFGSTRPQYVYNIGSVETFEKDVSDIQKDFEKPVYIENLTRRNVWGDALSWILPVLLLIGAWFFIMRMMSRGAGGGGQIFNIGKSKAQLFDKDTHVSINFNDVAGLEEAKVEIMEIVDFLKNPKKYTTLGGKIPKGALLVGPPGTGKTLLAKAVAGEAKVPFFSLSGSDFVEMFVGVGASRVRDLFKQAKEKAPCIIFIDEIDAIGRARGRNQITGANDERENTLNQLLTEMDGFATNAGVIILAATNRADILDRALLRAGRFDRQIHVELPDLEERKAIFKVHMKPLKFDESVGVDFLSKQTPGFSGADIANVCNEAALIAARRNKTEISKQDFMDAIDRIIGGLEKRNKIISPQEKKVIAFHEAGHAAVSWLLQYAHPLVKVTIVPRGKALGAAWYLPEERQITTYEQMFDELVATLGGRASEDVVFGKISTGALNDLEKVTKQAYAMVVYFGLNKEIGNVSYYDSTGQQEYSFSKPYSEATAQLIDTEIKKIIEQAYSRAKEILSENRDKLEELASILLKKEVIFREDLETIFGKRPFDESHEFNGQNGPSENAGQGSDSGIQPVEPQPAEPVQPDENQ
ncbi:ATP-dependent metalloprotease FtsH [Lentimicrobium saccharophilum]|uniref:ATP-dependent zinc metalloprotease FtsH n=1 Tax=Lentimicrobium saccharophilum TaxID=1678841 RepID=A0A0S7BWH5_9BACT|nr:ATP-dependent zinc metalloprotease FtsH [Lentimicrobium saccharophilum]GAP42530.1 ATP-dependent metalloprotease FtsH [Lentimicrobium saccharophilum]